MVWFRGGIAGAHWEVELHGFEFFYEATCCQAPFSLYTLVTPSVVNRASGFLKRETSVCLERTSIRAGLALGG
jgi:hypothetical protein